MEYLKTKSISAVVPFAPAFTQQIVTRFESIALSLDSAFLLLDKKCRLCSPQSLTSHHYLYMTAAQLMDCMVHKITKIALRRAISKINNLLGVPSDSLLSYEAYAMFNILFNVLIIHFH